MNAMADVPKAFKLAEEGMRNSPIYDALKGRILEEADLENKYVSKAHQISLFHLGHYYESSSGTASRSMSTWPPQPPSEQCVFACEQMALAYLIMCITEHF
jgi:hypothetical protein